MGKDVLVILMIAFGIFAIVMFVLFFVYLKKFYNSKRISDDYKKELDYDHLDDEVYEEEPIKQETDEEIYNEPKEPISFQTMNDSIKEVEIPKNDTSNIELESDMEFVPIKKK